MDINWKDFKEGHADEKFLADFQVLKDTQVLLWSTAWVIEGKDDIEFFKGKLDQLSLYNINYWGERLEPITKSKTKKPFFLVASNRVGIEETSMFIGSTCTIKLRPDTPSVVDLKILLPEQPGILTHTLKL